MRTEIAKYLAMSYTTELKRNEDGTWFARIVEFAGCMAEGDTREQALSNLQEAAELWLEVSIEDGLPIPEPLDADAYSGKFLMRVPKTLHRDIARRAALEGVSLNQFALVALSRAVGPLATDGADRVRGVR